MVKIFIVFMMLFSAVSPLQSYKVITKSVTFMDQNPKKVKGNLFEPGPCNYKRINSVSFDVNDDVVRLMKAGIDSRQKSIDLSSANIYIKDKSMKTLNRLANYILSMLTARYPDMISTLSGGVYRFYINSATYMLKRVEPTYGIKKETEHKESTQLNHAVLNIANKAKKKGSVKKQIAYVNKAIIKRTKYGEGTRHYKDAFGALIQRRATCLGYSCAFALCMDALNIPNTFEGTKTHIWNRVYVDEKWKVVDVTWNDTGLNSEKYLLKDSHI